MEALHKHEAWRATTNSQPTHEWLGTEEPQLQAQLEITAQEQESDYFRHVWGEATRRNAREQTDCQSAAGHTDAAQLANRLTDWLIFAMEAFAAVPQYEYLSSNIEKNT